jgi:hypothetical protein
LQTFMPLHMPMPAQSVFAVAAAQECEHLWVLPPMYATQLAHSLSLREIGAARRRQIHRRRRRRVIAATNHAHHH